jgi:hypothetical protein
MGAREWEPEGGLTTYDEGSTESSSDRAIRPDELLDWFWDGGGGTLFCWFSGSLAPPDSSDAPAVPFVAASAPGKKNQTESIHSKL